MFENKGIKRNLFLWVISAFLFVQFSVVQHDVEYHLNHPTFHHSGDDHSQDQDCGLFQLSKTSTDAVKSVHIAHITVDIFEAASLQFKKPLKEKFVGYYLQTRAPPVS